MEPLTFPVALKRDRLVAEFGEKGFDYAGNDRRDLAVWSSARKAIIVNSSRRLSRRAARVAEIERVLKGRERWLKPYVQALRLHQWLKNLLVFVPLVMAHRFFEPDLLVKAFLAFLAFGLCASSVYLINDLVDLPADRHHPRKRQRPFAAGELSLLWGFASIPLLLGLSLLVSLLLPLPFLGMLVIYFVLNLAYSFYLKRIVLLDVIVLAGLYTMRIMAGSASVAIWPSSWLLAFSTFLFLSLALVKRYAELVTMGAESGVVQVRGYQIIDKELLASLGSGSGYVAVLVLAIYISSGAAEIHYTRHQLIWLLCPLLLYWISYVWLIAHRGGMHDDPLVFTVRDRVSRIVILLGAVSSRLPCRGFQDACTINKDLILKSRWTHEGAAGRGIEERHGSSAREPLHVVRCPDTCIHRDSAPLRSLDPLVQLLTDWPSSSRARLEGAFSSS